MDATQKRAVKILEKASTVIQNNGWCQNQARKPVGKQMHYCAMGAVSEAYKNFTAKDKYEALTIASEALDKVAGNKGFDGIVDLNDSDKTDKRKVLRAFKKAVELVPTIEYN